VSNNLRLFLLLVSFSILNIIYANVYDKSPDHLLNVGLLSLIISILIEYIIRIENLKSIIIKNNKDSSSYRTKLSQENSEMKGKIEMVLPNNLNEIKNKIERYPHIKNFGKKIIEEYERSIDHVEHGFSLNGENLVLKSYISFWEHLLSEQKKISKEDKNYSGIKANIVHSCSFKIWTNHQFKNELLRIQKQFVDAGGKIIRILCENREKPSEECEASMMALQEHNIDIRYYNIGLNKTNHKFITDFLYVEKLGLTVKWEAIDRINGDIGKASYISYIDKTLMKTWSDIFNASNNVKNIKELETCV